MKRIAVLALLVFVASSALAGEVLIPVVYRGPGQFGTQWRTEIVVSNVASSVLAPVVPTTITFHRDNGEDHVITQHLAPHEVLAVPDAVHDWFSIDNGAGIVRVTWDGDEARVMARARIYNAGEHGEYGQSVPGIETRRLVSDHFLVGLSGVDGNRTNVGVSNPTSAPTIVWIELFDTAGETHGSFATGIPPRSFRQFNDIFSYFQTGPLHAAMVRVTSMDTVVYAYASIVRNDTGDATFVMGQ